MRYAICNEPFGEWPLAKACDFAAACGYQGIEIAPFTLAALASDISAARRGEVRRTIARAGLDCVGLHWLLARTEGFHVAHPDRAVRDLTVDYLAELARLCQDLGGRVLVFGSPKQRSLLPGVTAAAAQDHVCDVFTRLVPVLETTDTVVVLEPLSPVETDVLTTADEKAMASESTPIPEVIRASAAHLEHFHANDVNLQGPGFGAVDFAPIFSALAEVRYAGWVSVEVFDYAPGAERLARESLAYMRQVEETLG